MISVSDFRNGVTFDMDGKVMQIVEFQHVKPGKGAAFVRVKMKNVITGGVTETTFNPNDKYPTAYIERKKMEYSYSDGDLYYFMVYVYAYNDSVLFKGAGKQNRHRRYGAVEHMGHDTSDARLFYKIGRAHV